MHEIAVAQSILDLVVEVAERNSAKKIHSIKIRVGRLSCINVESLEFAFGCVSSETIASGASLVINQVSDSPFVLEVESIEVD